MVLYKSFKRKDEPLETNMVWEHEKLVGLLEELEKILLTADQLDKEIKQQRQRIKRQEQKMKDKDNITPLFGEEKCQI